VIQVCRCKIDSAAAPVITFVDAVTGAERGKYRVATSSVDPDRTVDEGLGGGPATAGGLGESCIRRREDRTDASDD
jgi:hypothetical protein